MRDKRVIITSYVCIATSFFGLVIGTMAWFAMNKTVSGEGAKVNAKVPDISSANFDIHPVTDINGNEYTYVEYEDQDTITLGTYDPSDIVYNKYKKAVVIDFYFTAGGLVEDRTITFKVSRSHNYFGINNDNYLSNAISIYKADEINEGVVDISMYSPLSFVSSDDIISARNNAPSHSATISTLELTVGQFNIPANEASREYHQLFVITYNMACIEFFSLYGTGTISFSDDLAFDLV